MDNPKVGTKVKTEVQTGGRTGDDLTDNSNTYSPVHTFPAMIR
jgi:hypothetical protein